MIWIYLAALIFGGAFTIPMLLGGLGADADADFDGADLDGGDFDAGDLDGGFDAADIGGDIEIDLADGEFVTADTDLGTDFASGGDSLFDGVGDFVSSLLSFRSIVFFSTFFGVAGAVLTAFDYREPLTFASAVVLGLVAAVLNTILMSFLRTSEANSQHGDAQIVGRRAHVIVPMAGDRRGRVKAEIEGQPHFLTARPHRPRDDVEYAAGDSVVVVEIDNGVALVAPLPSHEIGD